MWLDGLAELIFPPRCAACDAPGAVLCAACREKLPRIDGAHACGRCGAPIAEGRQGCSECGGRAWVLSACRSVGLLKPPLSHVVTVYKDAGERRLAPVIGQLLCTCAAEWTLWADAIVPVPPRPGSISTRGFDHMRLLAREVSVRCDLPVRTPLRAWGTADQRTLGREARFANAAGRYHVREGMAVPAKVLLLDDVFTTGATLEACAAALVEAGSREVRAVTLARATDIAQP